MSHWLSRTPGFRTYFHSRLKNGHENREEPRGEARRLRVGGSRANAKHSGDNHKLAGLPTEGRVGHIRRSTQVHRHTRTQAKKSYRLSRTPCVEMMFTLAATAYLRSRQSRAQLNNGPKRPTSFSTELLSAESWFCGPIDLKEVNPCPIIRGPDEQRCSWINTDQNLLATLCFLLIPLNGTNIRV